MAQGASQELLDLQMLVGIFHMPWALSVSQKGFPGSRDLPDLPDRFLGFKGWNRMAPSGKSRF